MGEDSEAAIWEASFITEFSILFPFKNSSVFLALITFGSTAPRAILA